MTTHIDATQGDKFDGQINLIGPGSRLRLARENANLSISDVAMRLHLRSQMIQDLENDDYAASPQFVFIRGYLRAYANLLIIPPQEIIDAFNALNIEESPTDRPVWRLTKKQVSSKDRPVRWATYFIILCLITLVGIWWHSQKNNFQNKSKLDNQTPVVMQDLTNSPVLTIKNVDVLPTTQKTVNKESNKQLAKKNSNQTKKEVIQ